MDRSKLSLVISTTRLLPHFSSTNVDAVKTCIFEQLGIETDAQFVCIALKCIYKSLSSQSLSIIKTKAIEVAKNQLMPHKPSTNTTQSNAKPGSQHEQPGNMTVYKYIEKQNDKGLCQLHSDIIDYLGTFLNKKQSIEFGYLNKHLFIETQKQSYLLKRCKDDRFKFTSARCDKMLIAKNDAFNYTFPRSLTLQLKSRHANMVEKIPFFNNFFRRLSVLEFNSFSSLYCVPLHYLFIKNRNYFPNIESCENIDLFRMSGYFGTRKTVDVTPEATLKQVDIVCKNFDRLIFENSGDDHDKIRGIKQFEFELGGTRSKIMNSLSKRLFLRFGSISKSIHLCNTKLSLDTISEIKSIFHANLKHMYFDYSSEIHINVDVKNIENSVEIVQPLLESIEFDTRKRQHVANCISTLNQFDQFGIRRSIKQYIVHWNLSGTGGIRPRLFENFATFRATLPFVKHSI